MDLTGSIAKATYPLSVEIGTSSLAEGVGSSAIDTLVRFALSLPATLLDLVADAGADLGSTAGLA